LFTIDPLFIISL